jgi:hypothetical protein
LDTSPKSFGSIGFPNPGKRGIASGFHEAYARIPIRARENRIAIYGNLHYTSFFLMMQEKFSHKGKFFIGISQSQFNQ